MATDIATLALKVENGDVVKATTALDSLTVAGGKSEAAATRLTRRMALLEIEARNMDAAMRLGGSAMTALEIEARKLDAELNREARAMALVEIEARKMDAAMTASKQAAFAAEVRKTADAQERLAETIRRTDAQMEKTGKTGSVSFGAVRNAIAALGIGVAIREFSQLSDTYSTLHSRLALVTTGTANLAAVEAELFDVSQRTRTSFEGTADLYGKIARNAAQLGVSQRDVLNVTETISKAMIIGGGAAESNRAAIVQLGQALASGTLRGDELNSVMEQSPRLAQALADGLGVTIGQLRQMGKDGELTSQQVITALLKMRDTIDREFTQIPTTIGGAWQTLRNEIVRTVGAANEAGGMSGGIVTAINAIRDAIPPAFKMVNAFFGGIAIGSADAALSLEKVRQKAGEIQMALGLMMKARGTPGADFLIGNAAKVLKDGDDILRMLEKQREEVIKNVHAITTAGTVSTDHPTGKTPPVVDPNAAKDLKALQDATDAYYNSLNQHQIDAVKSAAATRQQNDELRAMIDATRQGQDAVDALTVAQAGANAVRDLGVGVSERQAAAVRREAEEHARLAIELGHVKDAQSKATAAEKKSAEDYEREVDRRSRQLQRATSNAIEQGITDVVNGKNPLIALADGFKRAMIHAVSEALAERFLASKFAAMLGIGVEGAAKKQDQAAIKMLAAAKLQDDAASKMLGAGGKTSTAGGIVIDNGTASSDSASKLKTAAQGFGVAVAGFSAGYQSGQATSSTSHSTFGNYARGALGGALSGAAAGAAAGSVFGPIGTAVGGAIGAVTGFVGGIFGAKKAMNEAAKAANEMRAALKLNMDALRNEVAKDALAGQIAQVEAQREQLRKQIEDAYSGGGANSDTVRERNRQLAELNTLENERIRQLKEEAATMQARQIEDYQVRQLRAEGKDKEAAALQFQHDQAREREDLVRSFGPEIDAREAAVLAALDAAQAAEKQKNAMDALTDSVNVLNTAVRFAPTGFKLAGYIQDYATASPMPTPKWAVPTNPFVPPQSPLTPPPMLSASQTSAASSPITFHITINESDTPELTADAVTRMVVGKIDEAKNATGGLNMTRAAALERMKGSPVLRS